MVTKDKVGDPDEAWRRVAGRVRDVLRGRGHEVDVDPCSRKVRVDGVDHAFRVLHERSRDSWISRSYTGNFRVSVYEYTEPRKGRYHSLPQRKDGSHDYEKLADVLERNTLYWKDRHERERAKEANESVVLAALRATGLDDPDGRVGATGPSSSARASVGPLSVSPSEDPGRPVRVALELRRDLDRFQFERLVLFLRSEGHLEGH